VPIVPHDNNACASLSRKKPIAHGTACSMSECTMHRSEFVDSGDARSFPSAYADKMRSHAKNETHFFYRRSLCTSTHPRSACFRTVTRTMVDAQITRKRATFIEERSQKWHTCRESLRLPLPQVHLAKAQTIRLALQIWLCKPTVALSTRIYGCGECSWNLFMQ